jgi:UDP-N-acetylglucosamine 2-epimerase
MPEEINRRLTDHASTLLFAPTPASVANLRREGVRKGVHRVGDVMRDAIDQNLGRALKRPRPSATPRAGTYYLATVHRQENTDDPARLGAILGALEALPHPAILPLHPRTARRLESLGRTPGGAVRILPPQPYLEMLRLVSESRAVLTDSGGLQKEAYLLGAPCVTLRESTEWVETLAKGANRLVGADPRRLRAAIAAIERQRPRWNPKALYGDGHASERIVDIVTRLLAARR